MIEYQIQIDELLIAPWYLISDGPLQVMALSLSLSLSLFFLFQFNSIQAIDSVV